MRKQRLGKFPNFIQLNSVQSSGIQLQRVCSRLLCYALSWAPVPLLPRINKAFRRASNFRGTATVLWGLAASSRSLCRKKKKKTKVKLDPFRFAFVCETIFPRPHQLGSSYEVSRAVTKRNLSTCISTHCGIPPSIFKFFPESAGS